MAGMNPAFAAAIERRKNKSKGKGGKKVSPFTKKGKGPQDPDAGPNDPAGPADAQDKGLPQFLKK